MFEEKGGIMSRDILEPVAHSLQHGNLDSRLSVMDDVLPIDNHNKAASLGPYYHCSWKGGHDGVYGFWASTVDL